MNETFYFVGDRDVAAIKDALKNHQIELPSWAFGNSGTLYRSNIELRGLSWDHAAWWYSLITPAAADFRRIYRKSATSRTGCVSMSGGQGQVALTENQDPVQQFAAQSPDDPLADGVHPRRPRQRGDREDLRPPAPAHQPGQRRKPQPAGVIPPQPTGQLAAQDLVLMAQYQQLGILGQLWHFGMCCQRS
jgi:hypothetical protein